MVTKLDKTLKREIELNGTPYVITLSPISEGIPTDCGNKANGSIVCWGHNQVGQCNVPAPNQYFVAVDACWYYPLGLKSDGTVIGSGRNDAGQCNVPPPNQDFVAIAAGDIHSLGLKSNGTIVAWESPHGS